ncbi:ABC transporter substrate-binding protein [Niastella koreensis]|uniref:Arabinan endo-1,5-alpha-L-arabinosidase n=2 Tax=Niastella koreensis TaxID=354356 RepID=G8TBK1_NIAKG|nr:arabinan endo-1,5-alpha-L-arabinosidase [Niastella koreensis]AEV97111.1 Arabinan endo-1,5-alpha-L-arabinosidase [Niastella koreensis GR20-10]OQP39203.1 ABC transporter substrate-binding protein [Niastella koreensis]
MKYLIIYYYLLLNLSSAAQPIPAHDPVLIKQDSVYYMFCTGQGITEWSSVNMVDWKKEPPVFAQPPAWVMKELPAFKGHTWAPDMSFHNGQYYLYYAVSAFGKNTSCIGVATNKTLHPGARDFHWEDRGKLVQSVPNRDDWNAIDPNLFVDDNDSAWLTFGSFWSGIKLVKLNNDLVSLAHPEEWYNLANRRDSGTTAIEAPFLFKKGKYYYLFVSVDYCCRGLKSTYKVLVGRSEKVTGPYIDKNNVPMMKGGGSLVAAGDTTNWVAIGHNSVYTFDGKDYIVYHGYDAKDNGKSKLIIRELGWDANGWPKMSELR